MKFINRRKLVQKKNAHPFRTSRERTTTGQSQALWTFLVASAVAIAALMQMNHPTSKSFHNNTTKEVTEVVMPAPEMTAESTTPFELPTTIDRAPAASYSSPDSKIFSTN